MKSYRSPKTEVMNSPVDGRGLFCAQLIEAGEIVGIRTGEVVGYDEAMRRDRLLGGFSMQVTEEYFLCPSSSEDVEDIALFINHCCDPNVWLQDQIVFVARSTVYPGEELLFDYAMNLSTPYDKKCNCGSVNCRKRITGEDWRLPEIQNRYSGHFDPIIQRLIESATRSERSANAAHKLFGN